MSISEIFILADFRTLSVAGIGPVNIIVGSVPTLEVAIIFALGFRLAISPNFLLPTSTAADPSTIPLELPA